MRNVWTCVDVAERLSIKPREVEIAAIRGELPCAWWGKQPLFSPADIEIWLSDQSHRSQHVINVEHVAFVGQTPEPYQRADGRWSVRLKCPDGRERRFISRGREPIQSEHRQKGVRVAMSVNLRFTILRRDEYTCQYCGRSAPEVELEIDHRIPVADGGTDDPDNLVAACVDCNAGKGRRTP